MSADHVFSYTMRITHLYQRVSHQSDEQSLPFPLLHQRGVLGPVHGGEVKHGHVRLARVVLRKLHVRQHVICGEVGGIVCVLLQGLLVDVFRCEQLLDIREVLRTRTFFDQDEEGIMLVFHYFVSAPFALQYTGRISDSTQIAVACRYSCENTVTGGRE